jgi:ribosomal protein S12 methylthiotransferase
MLELFARLRERMPDVVLRTTVLVGYPGETDADVETLREFIEQVQFDRLGAFIYSKEEGTRAASEGPAVPPHVAEARYHAVMQAQQAVAFRKTAERVGSEVEVVIDGPWDRSSWAARSYAEAPDVDGLIRVRGRGLASGQFVTVRIESAHGYDLEAGTGGVPPRREDSDGSTA